MLAWIILSGMGVVLSIVGYLAFSPASAHGRPVSPCTHPSARCMCVHAKSLQLCLTFCNPLDCSPPGSSAHGILQARILEWVAMPSSKGSFWPKDRTRVSCLLHWQAGSLPLAPSGKASTMTKRHFQMWPNLPGGQNSCWEVLGNTSVELNSMTTAL